ncbi:hypothetical protein LJR175_008424 [Variovorax sp. LjRoot175]|uniref:hypothetical protein n=1 Tax=Variovorax sp. LjRoot175 TaxID=3342276 RepID=UPI003ECD9897
MSGPQAEMTAQEEIASVLETAVQACAACRHELNDLEVTAWLAAIEAFGPTATTKFLLNWVSTNSRKAPTVADLRKALDPTFVEEETALERLYLLVSRVGPYDAPNLDATGPMLCRAIENMGGWARVNEIMPDRGDRFAWSAFADRFATAFGTARTQEFQDSLLPPDRRTALPSPKGIHQISVRSAHTDGDLLLTDGTAPRG